MKLNEWISLFLVLFITSPIVSYAEAEPYHIPNPSILNQDGKTLQFYDDVVKGKTVAINFIFTRCQFVCPLAGLKFAKLRQLIKDQQAADLNKSLQLISITTDVPFDTPQRLKDWAENFGAGSGWTQLTGDKQNVTALLKSLQAFVFDKQEHSSMVLMINDAQQQVKWMNGDSDPQTLLAALQNW